MQRLNHGMMRRYEIPEHLPPAVNAVQFGLGEALLGVADRLIDGAGPGVGIACVPPEGPYGGEGGDPAALLAEQDGLYTVLERGYRGETPVKREVVVQSVVRVARTPEDLAGLATLPGLGLGLADTASPALTDELRPAARLLALRHRAGLGGLEFVCLGEDVRCGALVRRALAALAGEAGAAPGFEGWLEAECRFYPALAEGFARRADAREAAKQCAEMNYADGMLLLAEPFARLTVQAPGDFAARWGLEGAEGFVFTSDLGPSLALKHRLFDGGLFAMAAPGWLLGLDALSDCMKHERLRAFAGRAFYDELLPRDPKARRAATPYAIECFERFENPLGGNDILRAARPLLARFARGALPAMRAWTDENFEPPRRLSFALAATIMLYAGARSNAAGRYEVARGNETQLLEDEPEALARFARLSHDMSPESLAYAALADRELWNGADLRAVDGLEQRVALDLARIQRQPGYLPEEETAE